MANKSRTQKSVKNSIVSLTFFAIRFFLNFYSRKIFLEYLGTEILGLNTTAVSILQFLNLAELGINTAVGFSLYKPIFDKDEESINEIVSLQGHLYRRIANFIILASCIVMCFFPLIFHKIHLPLWYAYASFIVLLYAALLGYYVNYKQIVLSSAQMDYKIQYSTNSWTLVKIILQIVAVSHFSNPYLWWLVFEVIFSTISAITLSIVTRRAFPFLRNSEMKYRDLKKKYIHFLTKIKQLFVHQISAFALGQSTSLVIYAFANLSLVAIYGNYLILTNGVISLLAAVFNSMGAGIGNLIAEGNRKRIMSVFNEIFSLRFLISSTIAFSLLVLGQPLMCLWVGRQYLLPYSSLVLVTAILFIRINRYTVNNFINAHGLYSDIWAAITEAGLNIGLSVLFGYFWGLNGILTGVLVSIFLIVDLWKPYFLFSKGLNSSPATYFLNYIKHLIMAFIAGGVAYWIISFLPMDPSRNWLEFIGFAAITNTIFILLLSGLLLISNTGIRNFSERILKK